MSDDSKSETIVSTPVPWVPLKGKLKLWLKAYLDDSNPVTFMNKAGSARAAKYNCSGAQSFANVGCQNYIKLQDRIDSWMDDHGLTKGNNSRKLLELSEAEETKIINIKGKVDEATLPDNCKLLFCTEQVKYSTNGDKYTEYSSSVSVNLKANETQRRTLDMMIKVKGQYAVEKIDIALDDKLLSLMAQGRKRAKDSKDE